MSRIRPAVALAIGLIGFSFLFMPLPVRAAQPAARTIRIEASQFAYQPAVIQVNQGDTVTLELVSTDVVHGLYVDGYGLSLTADPGRTARITFVAGQVGSFRIRCNQPCGAMHPFMIGELKVGTETGLLRALGLAGFAALALVVAFPVHSHPQGI